MSIRAALLPVSHVLMMLLLAGASTAQELPADAPVALPTTGRLIDASFETAAGLGEAVGSAWSVAVMAVNGEGEQSSQLARDEAVTRGGEFSLRLSGAPDTVRWSAVAQVVERVHPGRRYRLAAWMATKDVRQAGRQYVNSNVFVKFKDARGSVIPDENGYPVMRTQPLLGTHDWRLMERILRAPVGASTATVGCFLSCAGTAWFDDLVFEALATPDWHTVDTGRYVYHWEKESRPPQLVVRGNAAFLEDLEQRLDTTLDRPVMYYYYDDNARKAAVTGNAGNAHVEGSDEIHSIFWSDRHEIVHLLTRRWPGRGTALLGEGLAVHLSGSWHSEPVDVAARTMQGAATLVPLADLVSTTGFRAHDDLIAYPQAGSFVKHLVETYGVKSFREVYTTTPLDPDAATFDALLMRAYGKDLPTLQAEWLAALADDD